jgi:hypothetical protein
VGRYSFGVELFHLLLHAGLSRRFHKIEHRLFSHISMNWRGRPLTSHEVIVNAIAATTTRAGLTVHAELDPGAYPKGTKIPDREIKALVRQPQAVMFEALSLVVAAFGAGLVESAPV